MNVRLQPVRVCAWSLVLVMMVFAVGCGHRSSHGSQSHSKKSHKATMVANQAGSDHMSKNGSSEIPRGGEGYFGSESGTFSDLLDDDAWIQEDPQFGDHGNRAGSSNDYWLTRTHAEQLTARSGLEDVHFDFNSIQLNDRAKTTLIANAEWLKANPEAGITIEGHCDFRGTSSYNYVLGKKRALRTKNYLTGLGVSSERLTIMSFGKDNPVCRNSTEPCFQKNRRAHLVLDVKVASTVMR